MFQSTEKYWKKQAAEKEKEISKLRKELNALKKGKSVKIGDNEENIDHIRFINSKSNLFDECLAEVNKLKQTRTQKELEKSEQSPSKSEDKKTEDEQPEKDPIFQFSHESMEALVVEVATLKSERNREIEDLKEQIDQMKRSKENDRSEFSDENEDFTEIEVEKVAKVDAKHVSFEETDENEKEEGNDNDTSDCNEASIVREEDLDNIPVLLSTLVKELQEVKAKLSVIEKSFDSQPTPVSYTGGSSMTNLPILSGKPTSYPTTNPIMSQAPSSVAPESSSVYHQNDPSIEEFKSAQIRSSAQLEQIQRELTQLKSDQSKFARSIQSREKSKMAPTSYSKRPQSSDNKLKFTRASVGKENDSNSRTPARSTRGILKPKGGQSEKYSEKNSSPYKLATQWSKSLVKTESSDDEDFGALYEMIGYNDKTGLFDYSVSSDLKKEEVGRVRPSDDFDWTKGVHYPSDALSQEALDRGEKYLKKVVKRYNADHPEEMGSPGWYRYGSADKDLEMIEKALQNSFLETESGTLVYVKDKLPDSDG
ncbi:uncharacterized protein LOC142339745 isoform X2 [Convolutriloba macropyga]|uniref:uncharacterized protein LOC142339745 isoform X2 n=1 Tax=Convolutriloba macropyga TaxID=536237 RepID=UPI003F525CC9